MTRPFEKEVALLQTVPGIGLRSAQVLVAEIGIDMSRFPSAAHLASWARVCPGNNESAGKRRSGRTGRGNLWLRTTLVESAWAASHSRNTYLAAAHRRIARRRGQKRATIAIAHRLLIAAYHILDRHLPYIDLGPDHFDQINTKRRARYHLRRLKDLGVTVSVEQEVA